MPESTLDRNVREALDSLGARRQERTVDGYRRAECEHAHTWALNGREAAERKLERIVTSLGLLVPDGVPLADVLRQLACEGVGSDLIPATGEEPPAIGERTVDALLARLASSPHLERHYEGGIKEWLYYDDRAAMWEDRIGRFAEGVDNA